MITRMEITYRSKERTNQYCKVFSSGSYRANKNGIDIAFDFENSEWTPRHEDGYLYIDLLQKNYDSDVGLPQEEADPLMRTLKKEDFIEIHVECYADDKETQPIELIPVTVIFYDYSTNGDGKPIEVQGDSFSGLV